MHDPKFAPNRLMNVERRRAMLERMQLEVADKLLKPEDLSWAELVFVRNLHSALRLYRAFLRREV